MQRVVKKLDVFAQAEILVRLVWLLEQPIILVAVKNRNFRHDFRSLQRGREKFHYLNPVPIHQVYDRWIGKYDRHRAEALGELKKRLEAKKEGTHHG